MVRPKRPRIKKYTCRDYQKAALEFLKPPETLTVSEWAERNRVLTSSSAEPGPWSNRRTPYLVGIMDEFTNYETEEIIFVKPTQVGGTACMENMIGYVITQEPGPTEIVYPTETLALSISSKRLRPMMEASPALREKYDEASPALELDFPGADMFIKLVGSNSPAGLASFAMKYLFIDEIDKFPGASRKEADPVSLAEERTKTFRGRKVFKTSTPTIRTGHIWRAKESADAEKHFFVPCPHCGEFIELRFSNLTWPGRNKDIADVYGADEIKAELEKINLPENEDEGEGLSDTDRAEFAFYICQECGCAITDQQKQQAVKKGRWETVRQNTRFVRRVCFWINTLYSPFVRFSEIAKKFMDARDDTEKLQNFVNSWLAEPWEDTRLKTSADLVLDRQTALPAFTVPEWAKILTAGVDVQKGYFYWTIRAWGDFITSQNIAHGQARSFEEIEALMNMEYSREDGTPMIVNLAVIDSGYETDAVYDFCVDNSEWAIPGKGATHEMNEHYRIGTVNKAGSKALGMQLVFVDGGKYKDMIASRMRKPNGRGSWMVYKDCDLEYAEQVTAEHKVAVKSGSKYVQRWVKKETHGDNHFLDCEVYAMAAADIQGVRMLHLQQAQQEQPEKKPEPEAQPPEEAWLQNNEKWI